MTNPVCHTAVMRLNGSQALEICHDGTQNGNRQQAGVTGRALCPGGEWSQPSGGSRRLPSSHQPPASQASRGREARPACPAPQGLAPGDHAAPGPDMHACLFVPRCHQQQLKCQPEFASLQASMDGSGCRLRKLLTPICGSRCTWSRERRAGPRLCASTRACSSPTPPGQPLALPAHLPTSAHLEL